MCTAIGSQMSTASSRSSERQFLRRKTDSRTKRHTPHNMRSNMLVRSIVGAENGANAVEPRSRSIEARNVFS